MATIEKVQARINAMPARMSAKGLRQADADFSIVANSGFRIYLKWKDETKAYDNGYKFIHAFGVAESLDEADEYINGLPSAEEASRAVFIGQLAKLIELGNDTGIDVDFVNPLVATMKRISENALTDQRGTA
ncbi:MAG: hypothetical protein ACAH27_05930 [Xanthobacteraceae bacterium]